MNRTPNTNGLIIRCLRGLESTIGRFARSRRCLHFVATLITLAAGLPACPAATVNWVGSNGDWSEPTNWDIGAVPGPADDVVIDGSSVLLTFSSGSHVVKSIVSQGTIVLSGGALTVSDTVQVKDVEFRNGNHTFAGQFQGTGTLKISGGSVTFNNDVTTPSLTGFGNASVTFNGSLNYTGSITFGSGTVIFSQPQTFSVVTVNAPNGTLGGSGNVTITEQFALNTFMRMDCTGQTIIAAGALANLNGGANIRFGRRLVNNGTVNHVGGGLTVQNAVIENNGVWNTDSASDIDISVSQNSNNSFNNNGTFNKRGIGTASFGGSSPVVFNNVGSINVEQGILGIFQGGSNSGSVHVSVEASLRLGGNWIYNESSNFSVNGTVEFTGGNHRFINAPLIVNGSASFTGGTVTFGADQYQGSGRINISGGNITFNNDVTPSAFTGFGDASVSFNGTLNYSGPITVGGTVTFSRPQTFSAVTTTGPNGTLGGSGNVTITETFNLSTFMRMDGTGQTIIAAGAVANLTGGANIRFGRRLVNNGIVNHFGARLSLEDAVVENNGVWNADSLSDLNISVSQSSDNSFNNNGIFNKRGIGVAFFGGSSPVVFNNSGSINLENGSLRLAFGNLDFPTNASLRTVVDTTLELSEGSLKGGITNSAEFAAEGRLLFSGGGNRSLEIMSKDFGNVASGFTNNFAYNTIELKGNIKIFLADESDNSVGEEALYVENLIVPAGTTLDLGGLPIYARVTQIYGALTGGTVTVAQNSVDSIALNSKTSSALATAGEVDEWTFFGRSGQNIAVVVDTGASSGVRSPSLDFAEVRVLTPLEAILAAGSSTGQGSPVTLTDVPILSDGVYRIQVRAPTGHTNKSGYYNISVWEITPDFAPAVLNQTLYGSIETPFSVDRWTFSDVVGKLVRLDLISASSTGLAFTLRGPNGWVGFTNIINDSSLVSLPHPGAYVLSAFSTNGAHDLDYAFKLVEIPQTNLTVGSSFTGQLVGSGQAQLFQIDLPGNSPLRISLQNSGASNRVELYSMFGLPPTRGSFNFSDNQGSGGSREILIDNAYPGTHYILVYGDHVSTAGEYTITVEAADLFVTKVSPTQTGNGGIAIVEIEGVGLRSTAQVKLERNGTSHPATSITWISSKRLVAEFNLSSVPANTYQISVTQGASSDSVPFVVTGGTGAVFNADLIMPDGIGLNTVNTFFVEYSNSGDLPMVAPLLAVRADPITFDSQWRGIAKFSLEAPSLSRDFWSEGNPSVSRDLVSFYAAGRIPGLLLPGESARIPVYFLGIQPRPIVVIAGQNRPPGSRIIGWRVVEVPRGGGGSSGSGGFNVNLLQFLPPSVAHSGSAQPQPDKPLNWTDLRTNVPPNVLPAAWDAIWQNFTNAAGASVYSFFAMQEQNVQYLHRLGLLGSTVNNVDALLSFELAQADGIHMLRTLATATDGYAPAPGLQLSFSRSFPNSISGRYRLGVLGRGWSHNWEERLSTNEFGDVIITSNGGSQRTFKQDVRGGYIGDLGDYTQLVSLAGSAFVLREKGGLAKEFRADGKLNFIADPNGNRITCDYTGDRLTSLTHSSSQRLDLGYNTQGRIETITDSVGRITRFSYDPSGEHLATAEYYDGRALRYQYTSGQGPQREHALREIEFPDLSHQYFTYNARGRLETMRRDGGSELVTYAYDNSGTVFAINAFGHTTKFLFDNRGLLVRMENPKGEIVQIGHDDRFNLTSVTDPTGRSFKYTYDRRGNLTEIVNPLGHRTHFAYEPQFQRLSQLTDAKGNPTRYNYDDRGNLRGITYANNKSENWGYDAIGNPTTWTNRRRNDIDYQFNPTNGFLMAKLYPDNSRADYEYDPRGNLIAASNYTGRITLNYFPTNDRLQRVTFPGNRWLDYTYDAAGRRRTMTDHLYQLRYDYDAVGRLSSITNSDNLRLVHYQYDAAGRMALKTLGNGVFTSYTYDDVSRLEKLTNALPNGSALSFFNYTYDERGRRIGMATHYGAWTYRYDNIGQLTNAVLASTDPQIPNQNLTYLYDAMGNRVRNIENGVATDYAVNNLNQYTQVGGTNATWDDDGNLSRGLGEDRSGQFDFDEENLLTRFQGNQDVVRYERNPLGDLASSNGGGPSELDYVWDPVGDSRCVLKLNFQSNLESRSIHGAGLIALDNMEQGLRYFCFDAMGNVSDVVDGSGSRVGARVFEPFGSALFENGQFADDVGFGAEYGLHRGANGMTRMGVRFYDARIGRFVSTDALGLAAAEVNYYVYGRNNPLSYVDHDGHVAVWIITGVAGGAFNAGAYLLEQGADATLAKFGGHFASGALQGALLAFPGARAMWGAGAAGLGSVLEGNNPGQVIVDTALSFVPIPGVKNWGKTKTFSALLPNRQLGFRFWTGQVADAILGKIAEITDLGEEADSKILVPIYAIDPNQKLVLTGLGERGYVESGKLLPYRIDFENDTNATAPAQSVFVTDRLTNILDWTSFELTEIGFGDERITLPPQTQDFETNLPVTINGASFVVHIQAGIRLETGEVFCTFRSIDPNTDLPPPAASGFLPPENGTGRGQGFVSYLIRANADLASGSEIRNVALIDFDGRETIATNQREPHNPGAGTDPLKEALITLDDEPPSSAIGSLPVSVNALSFPVTWTGSDSGAGVASYDILVSTNGDAWGFWLNATTNVSSMFVGENGNHYAFYSIARDYLGHIEAPPLVADTTTRIELPRPPIEVIVSQSPSPDGTNTLITLSYPTVPGESYMIEYRDDLDPVNTWQPLPGNPHNSGSITVPNLQSQRFYRLRINE